MTTPVKPQPKFSPMPDRGAYDAEWRRKTRPDQADPSSPVTNPFGIATEQPAFRYAMGKIIDAVAYLHVYRVQFGDGTPVMVCTPLASTSLAPHGVRAIGTYVIGSSVLVAISELSFGLIMGAVPSTIVSPDASVPDYVTQASRCGIVVDRVHGAIADLANAAGLADFSSGRPYDGLPSGEQGWITETGIRIFIDSAMAAIATDEQTGLWTFYDGLLRIGGRHLQIYTAGSERLTLDDQGEIHHYSGMTAYPWEQLGRFSPGDPAQEIDPDDYQGSGDKAHLSAWEPLDDRQQPFHRIVTLGGYIGNGRKTMVFLPRADDGLNLYDDQPNKAVFEQQLSHTGRMTIRTAHSMILAKRPAIPAMHRTRVPEDATGDTPDNYRPSGIGENGVEHTIAASVETSDRDSHMQRLAAIDDIMAHTFNHEGLQPLSAHEKDWTLTEESDAAITANETSQPFESLASKHYLDPPKPVTHRVDHRYKDIQFFENGSYLAFTEDGGIVLGCAYGSEIRLCGGEIGIAAPGNVLLQPGRNLVAMPGQDAIIRARHAVDISAGDGDARVSAYRNLQMLGGNSGTGGVLIESKGATAYDYTGKVGEDVVSGGVQIKSAGDVAVWGGDVYLRATKSQGQVAIDAAAGTGSITINADSISRFVRTAVRDVFGPPEQPTNTNLWGDNNLVGGTFRAGASQFGGDVLVSGNIIAVGGHIATEQSGANSGKVGTLAGASLTQAAETARQNRDLAADANDASAAGYDAAFAAGWYAAGRAGNKATLSDAGFSHRTDKQYRTDDWRIWETRWQQRARLKGGAKAWTEHPVQAAGEKTYPFPGRVAWAEREAMRQQDLLLYDVDAGVSKPRTDDAYQTPTLKAATRVTADGNYVLII